ncbi:MAG: cupin domain-containing protein [Firmicutes bacterium]|nr:cupin domain-containing protein [Bacillota bacterium]
MSYLNRSVENVISVKKLVCFYAHEYIDIVDFTGEQHNFWEMVYVEEGQLVEISGEETHHLSAGDVIFHKPNVFHRTINPGRTKIRAYDISFQCPSRAMDFSKTIKAACHLHPSRLHGCWWKKESEVLCHIVRQRETIRLL